MSGKKSAIDLIREKLAEQERIRLELEEVRKDAAKDIGKVQEQIVTQEAKVVEVKASYDSEMKVLNELKNMLAIISGKPVRKKAVSRGGAVKETFRDWAKTAGQFAVRDIIDAGITPSGGYARILVTSGIADGILQIVPDMKPVTYISIG